MRSYKVRGAYNLIAQLDDDARAAGVVTASAGNHAQGVAYACAALGVHGRIYLPRTTPRQKRDRIAVLGGKMTEIVVGGDSYDDAAAAASADAAASGATLVPAFDDPRTIAGQGTVAREIIAQLGFAPDVLVFPVGGGGLLAGAVAWLGQRYPEVRVVGAEPAGAACVTAALAAGRPGLAPGPRHVRRRRRRPPGRGRDLPADRRLGRRADDRRRGPGVQRDAGPVPVRRDHRRARRALATAALGRPGHRAGRGAGGHGRAGRHRGVRGVGRQQRRQPVCRGRGAGAGPRGPQALLPGRLPAGARRAAPVPGRGPGTRRRHHAVRVRQAEQPGDRPALVGIELSRPEDLPALLARMEQAPPAIERVDASSTLFRFLL